MNLNHFPSLLKKLRKKKNLVHSITDRHTHDIQHFNDINIDWNSIFVINMAKC